MDMPSMDHRGPEFGAIGFEVLAGIQRVFRTKQPVIIYPSSGTGAWEAAIVNTLAPGNKVLMAETGQFAVLWHGIAEKFNVDVDFLAGRLEARRGSGADRGPACGRSCASDQGRSWWCTTRTSTGCVTHPLAGPQDHEPSPNMVSTINSAGCFCPVHDLADLERMRDAAGRGLVVHHHDRLDLMRTIGRKPGLDLLQIRAAPPVARQKIDVT